MTDVDYDAAAMRSALLKLREIQIRLEQHRSDFRVIQVARSPGTAPATHQFHRKYMQWAGSLHERHTTALAEIRQAIKALIAVDRQYNNGELASELGFDKLNRGKG